MTWKSHSAQRQRIGGCTQDSLGPSGFAASNRLLRHRIASSNAWRFCQPTSHVAVARPVFFTAYQFQWGSR